jgi:Na+-driven multidrug efflux pump
LNNQLGVYGDAQLGAHGGDLAVAVIGIIYVVAMLIAMPIFGINQGAQPIIGYNYGALRFDRVKKTLQTAVFAATGLAMIGFVVAMLFPAQVVWLFVNKGRSDTPALLELGRHAMPMALMMLPIIGFQIVSASYFQAVGKPKQAMLLSLSRQVLLLIPAVLILPKFLGLDGVWLAMPTADVGSSLVTAVWLFLELRHLDSRHLATENAVG